MWVSCLSENWICEIQVEPLHVIIFTVNRHLYLVLCYSFWGAVVSIFKTQLSDKLLSFWFRKIQALPLNNYLVNYLSHLKELISFSFDILVLSKRIIIGLFEKCMTKMTILEIIQGKYPDYNTKSVELLLSAAQFPFLLSDIVKMNGMIWLKRSHTWNRVKSARVAFLHLHVPILLVHGSYGNDGSALLKGNGNTHMVNSLTLSLSSTKHELKKLSPLT